MQPNHTPGFLDAQRAVPNPDGSRKVLRFGGGLDLWIGPTSKTWRCKVQRDGKRTTLNLGTFPEMSIFQARAKRAVLRTSPGRVAPTVPDETLVERIAQRVAVLVREELARFVEAH